MNRIKIYLSRRGTGILFTLISIIAINCWQQVVWNFDFDNSFSIAAAKNISEGHGYTIKMTSADDLSKFYYDPLNRWPPGYSWLLVIVHRLFNSDWIHTTYILNAMGLTALVLVFRKMLFQLEYPEWIINVAVLYFGYLLHPFHFAYGSDVFGLLFFLLGLSILIKGIKSDQSIVLISILSASLLGLSAYMKYLYIPLSFLPVVSLCIYGHSIKRMDLKSAALKGCIFLLLIIGSLLLFQFLNSGQALYINPSKTGFYPAQLLWMTAVIPSGLINLAFLNMQLSIILHVSFYPLHIFWKVVNVCCMGWLVYISYKLFRYRIFTIKGYRSFYAIQACMVTIALFSYLMVLSATKNKHYADSFFDWVYVGELRYYSVFIVYILQFVTFMFLRQDYFFNETGRLIFRSIIGFILLIEVTHSTYFWIKEIAIEKKYGVAVSADQYLFKSMELTRKEMMINKNLVVCSNNRAIVNMCSLENIPVFYDLGKLKIQIPHSLPSTLLIAVDTTVPGTFVPILSDPQIKPDYIFRNVTYYLINLPKS